MTITLYLHKTTYIKDLKTLQVISTYHIETVDKLRSFYDKLNISTERTRVCDVEIQVTPEEFALIGVFNGGI